MYICTLVILPLYVTRSHLAPALGSSSGTRARDGNHSTCLPHHLHSATCHSYSCTSHACLLEPFLPFTPFSAHIHCHLGASTASDFWVGVLWVSATTSCLQPARFCLSPPLHSLSESCSLWDGGDPAYLPSFPLPPPGGPPARALLGDGRSAPACLPACLLGSWEEGETTSLSPAATFLPVPGSFLGGSCTSHASLTMGPGSADLSFSPCFHYHVGGRCLQMGISDSACLCHHLCTGPGGSCSPPPPISCAIPSLTQEGWSCTCILGVIFLSLTWNFPLYHSLFTDSASPGSGISSLWVSCLSGRVDAFSHCFLCLLSGYIASLLYCHLRS